MIRWAWLGMVGLGLAGVGCGESDPDRDEAVDTDIDEPDAEAGTGQAGGTTGDDGTSSGTSTGTGTSTTGPMEGTTTEQTTGAEGDTESDGVECTMFPEIVPDELPEFVLGEPVEVQFMMGELPDPYLGWSLVDAPDTLSIDHAGLMTGTFEDVAIDTLRVYVEENDPADFTCPTRYSSREYEISVVAP